MNAEQAMPLSEITKQIVESRPPVGMSTSIVAIDGCGGAGKSTLAARLSRHLPDCPVIHTDDFASWDNPLNWYTRMIEQVLRPLRSNRPATYQRFDWHRREMGDWQTVDPSNYVIIEGVSSARMEFRPFLAFAIFVETDCKTRLARGLARDGENAREQWLEWMREEDLYLAQHNPMSFVDVIVCGDPSIEHDTDDVVILDRRGLD